MHDMPMPGGWSMSMAWMRMPGETWTGAAASFLGMWVPMMVAMMLPSVLPALWRYRRSLAGSGANHADCLGVWAAVGYFCVWTLLGIAVFPIGVAVASAAMQFPEVARAVPTATGLVVIIAGVLQFTTWKARRLACCRDAFARHAERQANPGAAWREGMRLGLQCVGCCSGLMAVLLVVGVMDPLAMVAVTAAIMLERLVPAGEQAARIIGGLVIGTGLVLLVV